MRDFSKRRKRALAALLIGSAIFVLAYEAVETVRYYRWRATFEGMAWLGAVTVPSDDPALMWEYRPQARHKRIRTNNHGFRGPDVALAKPPGVVRLAFVGDSVPLGYGEEEADTFVRLVEEGATPSPPGARVEVLNFGVDGYAAPQIARLVETRVVDFEPDHVIYVMCLNDFDFTTSAGEKVRYFRKPRSFLRIKLEHLVRKLRGLDFHTHKYLRNRRRSFDAILDMRAEAEAAGATFRLALLPIFPRQVHSFAAYPLERIHDGVEAFARGNDIVFLDLLDEFRARGGPPRAYSNDVWHLNPDGHWLVGETLLRELALPHSAPPDPDAETERE